MTIGLFKKWKKNRYICSETEKKIAEKWRNMFTFCLIDVWIWVRMSEVRSVVSPGYGHLRLPIRELILYMKNVT